MSFIVAVKKKGICPHCKQKNITLLDIVERSCGETSMDARGQEEVLAYMKKEMEEYFEDNEGEDNTPEVIKKVVELSRNPDYEVACIHISENDDFLQGFLDESIESGDVVKIYG